MSACVGVVGRLFGHSYAARYSDRSRVVGMEVIEGVGMFTTIKQKGGETPERMQSRTYHYDICTRCGDTVVRLPAKRTSRIAAARSLSGSGAPRTPENDRP